MQSLAITHQSNFTARELLECAQRELKLRKRVYPNRVLCHRMTQAFADLEIARMQSIVAHFETLARQERLL